MNKLRSPVATDEQLMHGARTGDGTSFDELVRRHSPRLLRALEARMRHADWARDALQATWISVYRARDSFDVQRAFRPWLYAIAFNQSREFHRQELRHHVGRTDLTEPEPADASPEFARLETEETLARCLACLPSLDREIIRRHWLRGQSQRTISSELHVSVPAIKMRIYRAIRKMRAVAAEPRSIAC